MDWFNLKCGLESTRSNVPGLIDLCGSITQNTRPTLKGFFLLSNSSKVTLETPYTKNMTKPRRGTITIEIHPFTDCSASMACHLVTSRMPAEKHTPHPPPHGAGARDPGPGPGGGVGPLGWGGWGVFSKAEEHMHNFSKYFENTPLFSKYFERVPKVSFQNGPLSVFSNNQDL